jgi:predicted nucleotidyltransferase
MMMTLETLRSRREDILLLAEHYKAEDVRIFGSVARGDATETSDVDLLVHFRAGASLFDLIGLQQDTADLIHTKVDVVSDEALSPYLARRILSEAVAL